MYCGWAWLRVKIKTTEAEKNSTVSESIEKRVSSLQENGLDLFTYFEKIMTEKAEGGYHFGHADALKKHMEEVSRLKINYEIKKRRDAVEKDILRRNSFMESVEEYLSRYSVPFVAVFTFFFSVAAVSDKDLSLVCILKNWEFFAISFIAIVAILFAIWLCFKGLMNFYSNRKGN